MVTTAAAAILVAWCTEAYDQWRLRTRYAAALRDFRASKTGYKDGRLPFWGLVEASQRLMEAGLGAAVRRKQRLLSVTSHLYRVSKYIDEESNHPGSELPDWPVGDGDMVEAALKGPRVEWETWIDATEANEALDACITKVNWLGKEAWRLRRTRH